MIDPKHELPVTRQAELVGISRAAVYYVPRPISEADLALQRRIDALHLEHPFAGSRLLKKLLRREGIEVGRKHVATLMRRMGIEALYRKKNTSKPHPEHVIYPYLLRNVAIERAN
jgi:putative transposase